MKGIKLCRSKRESGKHEVDKSLWNLHNCSHMKVDSIILHFIIHSKYFQEFLTTLIYPFLAFSSNSACFFITNTHSLHMPCQKKHHVVSTQKFQWNLFHYPHAITAIWSYNPKSPTVLINYVYDKISSKNS